MAELIVALDFEKKDEAVSFVEKAGTSIEWFKIGSVLFTESGTQTISFLKKHGKKIFLDLKFHDIPNTVAGAVKNAVLMGVDMINVHASGGTEMMQSAVEAAEKTSSPGKKPLMIAVTVLTSLDDRSLSKALNQNNNDYSAEKHVVYLAKIAKSSGMDGVVSSAHEVKKIKEICGQNFITVVPGIRPSWETVKDDQKRIMTPRAAILEGADFIVIGRPILKAADPVDAVKKIKKEMTETLHG
jgi:orotidine-5'-phosphate decarboxylase